MAAVHFDTIRSIAFGSIGATYGNFGSALTQNWRMFRCTNNTDGDVMLSTDGTNDMIVVPAYSFVLYDCATNALNVKDTDWFVMALKTQWSIRYISAPTKNSVYLEGVFSVGV